MCLMTTASNEEGTQLHDDQPPPPPPQQHGGGPERGGVIAGGDTSGGGGAAATCSPPNGDDGDDGDDDGPPRSSSFLASSLASLEPGGSLPVAPTEDEEDGGDASDWQPSSSSPSATATATATGSGDAAGASPSTAPGAPADGSKWPRKGIAKPHPNDMLYGRGGGTNHHPGNKKYRKMVEDRKHRYVNSKRLEKPLIAFEIIKIWRSQEPQGRFLKKDKATGLWNDVGDAMARKKTSQALREQAPLIRELGGGDLMDPDDFDELGFDVDADEQEGPPPRPSARGESAGAPPPGRADVEVEHVLMDEECNFPPSAASASAPAPSAGGGGLSFQVPSESGGSKMEWRGYTSEQLMVTEGEVSTGRGLSFGVREHSLGEYPLDHATVTQTAIDAAFDQRSGAWATPPNYFAIAHEHSLTAPAPAPVEATDDEDGVSPSPASITAAPTAAMLDAIDLPSFHGIRSASLASDDTAGTTCSKDAIKRATSHQNETYETKRYLVGPSVKRAALNRGDASDAVLHHVSDDRLLDTIVDDANPFAAAASVDAAVEPPRVARQPFKDDLEMRELTQSMEKSTLVSMDELPPHYEAIPPMASRAGAGDRMTTIDHIAMDLMVHPVSLSHYEASPPMASRAAAGDRMTTIDHIAMDLMVHPVSLSRTNTEEIIRTLASDLDEGTVKSLLSGGFDPFDRTKST